MVPRSGFAPEAAASPSPGGALPQPRAPQAPRITARVSQYFKDNGIANGRLNHNRPSAYFLAEQVRLLPQLSTGTLDRATEVFKRVNACLKD
jgi:hypothetical protein